jgi:hypothetical protein
VICISEQHLVIHSESRYCASNWVFTIPNALSANFQFADKWDSKSYSELMF